jgi:hypothetical protein
MSDFDWREGVFTTAAGGLLEGQACVGTQEGHFGVGNYRTGGILNDSGDGSFIYLGE